MSTSVNSITADSVIEDVWTKDMLMAQTKANPGLRGADGKLKDPMMWGQPGYLTEAEADVYMKFKAEVEKRDLEFKSTIFSFGAVEGEVYAYCRWLRARKYVYDDVIIMIEEATKVRSEARAKNFYPDHKESLGCDSSLFFHHYPQLYSGNAKNGVPLFISKPGVLNVDAVECITTLDGIVKFHWFIMMHDFATRLQTQKAKDPNFKRFECVCVLDLNKLTLSQLNQRALAIIKEQSAIDSICFPETMNKMFIINGPRFFSASWSLIKSWLDPRTASKIEVISDRKTWEKKLLEVVDADQLPVDYGGKGPNTEDTIAQEQFVGGLKRMVTEVIYLRGHGSATVELGADEELRVTIFTRCTSGAKFTIVDGNKVRHTPFVDNVTVKHTGSSDVSEYPTSVVITESNIEGPGKIKVKADSIGSRWSSTNYLVVFEVFPKN